MTQNPPPVATPLGTDYESAGARRDGEHQLHSMKRLYDETVAEREILTKYRKMSQVASSDPVASARIAQLQYVSAKLADVERVAAVMARQMPAGTSAELAAYPAQIRAAADSGARALAIAISAVARGPDLGDVFVVRAAGRAMTKDISDYGTVSGVSSLLDEEFEKRESVMAATAAKSSGATARTVAGPNPRHRDLTCHTCGRVGHIMSDCQRDSLRTAANRVLKPKAATDLPPEPHAP